MEADSPAGSMVGHGWPPHLRLNACCYNNCILAECDVRGTWSGRGQVDLCPNEEEKMEGFEIKAKASVARSGVFVVECWPRELQQPYKEGMPQAVPPPPKAEVDACGGELAVRWLVLPEKYTHRRAELEEAVKAAVREAQ